MGTKKLNVRKQPFDLVYSDQTSFAYELRTYGCGVMS